MHCNFFNKNNTLYTQQTWTRSMSAMKHWKKVWNMFKINKKPERRHWRRSDVFIVNLENISQPFLRFLLLTLNTQIFARQGHDQDLDKGWNKFGMFITTFRKSLTHFDTMFQVFSVQCLWFTCVFIGYRMGALARNGWNMRFIHHRSKTGQLVKC